MLSSNIDLKIINLAHRTDRKEESISELKKCGITIGGDTFFNAYHKPECGALGCSLSHANLIANYLSHSSSPYLLVLEDDFEVQECDLFLSNLEKVLECSAEWDIFLLGNNQAVPQVLNSQTAFKLLRYRENRCR